MGGLADWPYEQGNIICAQQQALEASWSRRKPSGTPARTFIVDEFVRSRDEVAALVDDDQRASAWLEDLWFACCTTGLNDEAVRDWAESFVAVRNSAIHEGEPAKPIDNDPQKMSKLVDTADLVLRCTIRLMAALIRSAAESEGSLR